MKYLTMIEPRLYNKVANSRWALIYWKCRLLAIDELNPYTTSLSHIRILSIYARETTFPVY